VVDPTRRYPPRPVVCVGAVIVDGDRVVLVQRGQAPSLGEWSLPGGVVEIGETLEAAVIREAREETGLVVDVGPVLKVLERIHPGDDGRAEYHYVVIDYLCFRRAGTLMPDSDAADARWVGAADLDALRPTDAVREVVAHALASARTRA
jgi:8-oxo-dGTP diphosphatase